MFFFPGAVTIVYSSIQYAYLDFLLYIMFVDYDYPLHNLYKVKVKLSVPLYIQVLSQKIWFLLIFFSSE